MTRPRIYPDPATAQREATRAYRARQALRRAAGEQRIVVQISAEAAAELRRRAVSGNVTQSAVVDALLLPA